MSAVELLSPLSPNECVERLRAATDPDSLLGWLGSKPVIGRVSECSVTLRKRISYKNPFQTLLKGKLVARGSGTEFQGKPGIHRIVIAFYVLWFTGVALGCGFAAVIAGQRLLQGQALPGGLWIAALLLGGGVLLVCFGRYAAREEWSYLIAFVADVLAAGGGRKAAKGHTGQF